ncbi:MAG: hypothetical protein VX681_06640 [Myxococcota bacterium]|nr:hypothetical protein [Myxococcota bacterium]
MLSRLVPLGVTVVVGLAIAELGVRLLPSTTLGFDYVDGHFRLPSESEPQTWRNSLGVHDIEPPRERGNRERVLLLGDSAVEALAVPIDQGLARRLAHHLEQQAPGRYDVVSLSRGGWGQGEELAALARHANALDPDLVLLLFSPRTDPYNNARELAGREENLRQIRELRRAPRGWSRSFTSEEAVGFWLPFSALNRLLAHRLTVRALRPADPVPLQFLAFSPERESMWTGSWRETEQLLLQLRREAGRAGAGFAVASGSTPEGVMEPAAGAARLRAAHPELGGIDFDVDLPDRRVASICAGNGVPFRALQPELRSLERTSGPLHWRYDAHWNVAGNDAAGRLLAEFVIEDSRR